MSIELEGIERKALHLIEDARGLLSYMRLLRVTPDFETRAEDELRNAKAALTDALQAVDHAIAQYERTEKRRAA